MSFRDLIVRVVPLEPKLGEAKAKPAKGGWGTPEERYRRLCMLAQLCRYAYYVKHVSIVPDGVYDHLERSILAIEKDHRELIDPRSPTGKPGSEKEGSYPRSVVDLWHFCGDDQRTFVHMQAVTEKAIAFALEAFFVEKV